VAIVENSGTTSASCGVTWVTGVDTIDQRGPDPPAVGDKSGLPLNA
jgi:hypothetical protein